MTSQTLGDWLIDLPKKAQQFSIVFLQLGRAMAPVRERVSELPGQHVGAVELLSAKELGEGALVFVDGLEQLANGRGERLGEIRERVMREAGEGRCMALISASPKTAYPDTIGSDVVSDAKQVFAPVLGPADVGDLDDDFYIECVKELGDRTLMALGDALWDAQLGPREAIDMLSKPDIEALRGAGLVRTDSNSVSWRPDGNYKRLRMAVALVSAETVSGRAAVPDTFAELWTLERMIRNMVRRALVERMQDGWRESCLNGELRTSVLERAQKDTQPRASRMADLRDPLEWLTTTELLDLRERHELGGLGLEPYLWGKLRTDIVPIRNRVAHMRIVSDDDARLVRTWRKLVAEKLR